MKFESGVEKVTAAKGIRKRPKPKQQSPTKTNESHAAPGFCCRTRVQRNHHSQISPRADPIRQRGFLRTSPSVHPSHIRGRPWHCAGPLRRSWDRFLEVSFHPRIFLV